MSTFQNDPGAFKSMYDRTDGRATQWNTDRFMDDFPQAGITQEIRLASRQQLHGEGTHRYSSEGKMIPEISQTATSTTSYTSDSIPNEPNHSTFVRRSSADFHSPDPFHFDVDFLKSRSESSFGSWDEESGSKTTLTTLSTRTTDAFYEGRGIQREHNLALPSFSSQHSDFSEDFPDFNHENVTGQRMKKAASLDSYQDSQGFPNNDDWPIPLLFQSKKDPRSKKRQNSKERKSSSWIAFADGNFQPIDKPTQPPKVPELMVSPTFQPTQTLRRYFNRRGPSIQLLPAKKQLRPRTFPKPTSRELRRNSIAESNMLLSVSKNEAREIQWLQVAPRNKPEESRVRIDDIIRQESLELKPLRSERIVPTSKATQNNYLSKVPQPRTKSTIPLTLEDAPKEIHLKVDDWNKTNPTAVHSSKRCDTNGLQHIFQAESGKNSTNVANARESKCDKQPEQSKHAVLEALLRTKSTLSKSEEVRSGKAKVNASSNFTSRPATMTSTRNKSLLTSRLRQKTIPHRTSDPTAAATNEKVKAPLKPTTVVIEAAKAPPVAFQTESQLNASRTDSTDVEPTKITDDDMIKALNENPDFAKYARMLKVGLPLVMVQNAMQRDGIESIFPSQPSVVVSAKRPSQPLDPIQRFRLHWQTHANVRSNTLWAMIGREDHWLADVTVDEEEMTVLFQKDKSIHKPAAVSEPGATVEGDTGASGGAKVIDPKRANNCGIILARIKLSYREIATAIDAIDATAFTLEQVQGLAPYMPTDEERRAFQLCIGAVPAGGPSPFRVECEKFMVELIHIDKAKAKIEAMSFMKRLPICVEELKSDSRLLQKACEETMNSSSLRKILSLVLHVGNVVNTSGRDSGKGKAVAVHLESLLTLAQSKAFDRKTSFLDYVARLLRRSSPNVVRLYRQELASLSRAAHVQWSDSVTELTSLDDTLTEVRRMALESAARGGGVGGPTSNEDETRLLHATTLGRFALEASMRMISVHAEIEAAKMVFDQLVHYFGEGNDTGSVAVAAPPNLEGSETANGASAGSSSTTAPQILSHLAQFCSDLDAAVERAGEYEKAKQRELRRGLARGGLPVSTTAAAAAPTTKVLQAKAGTARNGGADPTEGVSPSRVSHGIVKARAKPLRSGKSVSSSSSSSNQQTQQRQSHPPNHAVCFIGQR